MGREPIKYKTTHPHAPLLKTNITRACLNKHQDHTLDLVPTKSVETAPSSSFISFFLLLMWYCSYWRKKGKSEDFYLDFVSTHPSSTQGSGRLVHCKKKNRLKIFLVKAIKLAHCEAFTFFLEKIFYYPTFESVWFCLDLQNWITLTHPTIKIVHNWPSDGFDRWF
jgi:hypothetical protein